MCLHTVKMCLHTKSQENSEELKQCKGSMENQQLQNQYAKLTQQHSINLLKPEQVLKNHTESV